MMKVLLTRIKSGSGELIAMPVVVLMALLFILGAVAGCITATYVSGEGETGLVRFISGYLSLFQTQADLSLFSGALIQVYKYPAFIFFFGLTALGVVLIPGTMAVRGFLLSFATTTFVRIFGLKGLLLAACVLGIQNLFILPVLFVLGVQGFNSSKLLYSVLSKKGQKPEGSVYPAGYFARAAFSAVVLFVCVLIEVFVTPVLASLVAGYLW